ncbi:MAG: hypothetical protein HY069_01050, partial [Chlamydiia bacterium]|nr:hypothetical protein [Chlamydiia bacterium]
MNFLKNTTPWVAASVFAVASLFGQDKTSDKKKEARSFEQGQDILKAQMSPNYTAPATTQVRGAWDFFVTGSFIYWQPTEDNLEYAVTNKNYQGTIALNSTAGNGALTSGITGNWVKQDFQFQPGFKVGLGMNSEHDDWDVFAEYTWLRDRSHSTTNGPITGDLVATRGFAVNSSGTAVANVYQTATQTFNCNFDLLNFEMGRSCYLGRALTVRPAVGVRGTLIRQKLHTVYVNNNIVINSAVPGKATYQGWNHSWSVGPRFSFNTNWLMGG